MAEFDYTDRDYAALRLRLQGRAQQRFPSWTDFNTANFGNTLLELFAFMGDNLSFYQDNQANESRITTARRRKSMIGLMKLIGYTLEGATAAQIEVDFTIAGALGEDIEIPAGSIVRTREATPTEFQLLEAVTIPAGDTTATGTVEHSKTHDDETFELDGSPNQQVKLAETPYIDDSLEVTINELAYTAVDNFINSTSQSRHYQVLVDENDRAYIRFGNGVNGIAPAGTLEVVYKTGGGTAGNVEANAIKELVGSFTTVGGSPVTISVTNPDTATVLGQDRETLEQAAVNGPASLRALERTVSRTDFEDNARLVDGVGRALAITKNEDPTVVSTENTTYVFIVPEGGGTLSNEVKNAVLTMYNTTRPVMTTHMVQVITATYKEIDVTAWVYVSSGVTAATVRQRIQAALEAAFEPVISDSSSDSFGLPNTAVNFGFYYKDADDEPEPFVRWSDILSLIKVSGVRRVGTPEDGEALQLNGTSDDVELELIEFPTLGTVTIYDGDTGLEIPLEE